MMSLNDRLLITTWKSFKESNAVLKHQSNNGVSPLTESSFEKKSKYTR